MMESILADTEMLLSESDKKRLRKMNTYRLAHDLAWHLEEDGRIYDTGCPYVNSVIIDDCFERILGLREIKGEDVKDDISLGT
jgi:hypothetical protein